MATRGASGFAEMPDYMETDADSPERVRWDIAKIIQGYKMFAPIFIDDEVE